MREDSCRTSKNRDTGPALAEANGWVTAEEVTRAVERIVEITRPVKVVVFGSRARGTHAPESDLGLAVNLRNFDQQKNHSPLRRSDLRGHMSIDLLVVSEERHEFMKDSIISVHHYIAHEGVTLYDERTGSIDSGAVTRISR